jgi:hypothetical protein
MAERGVRVDHPTFHRWAVPFLPLLQKRSPGESAWSPVGDEPHDARYTFTPAPSLDRAVRNPCCLNSPVSEPTVLAMGLRQNRRAGLAAFMLRRFTGVGKAGPLLRS